MSELRQDLATKAWVVIAPERLKGKSLQPTKNALMDSYPEYDKNCPFCPRNEDRFENIEIAKIPHPDPENPFKSSWLTRCVENKYKIFDIPENTKAYSLEFEQDGIYSKYPRYGHHELIIESPQHNKTIATMTQQEVEAVVKLYIDRFNKLGKNKYNLLTIIFKNHGKLSGASQLHPHTQIVGMRIVPNYIRFILEEAQRYFDSRGVCVFCKMIEYELEFRKRIIYENKKFISFIPYAASVPYHTRIISKEHDSIFGDMSEDEIYYFSDCLRKTLKKLYIGLSNPDFNLILRNPPYSLSDVPFYHWHVEILPYIITPGGFELGSHVNVNVIPPEDAAEHLLNIAV